MGPRLRGDDSGESSLVEGIITLTKQGPSNSSSALPEMGDGAPEQLDLVSGVIADHFNNRWGQGSPVSKEEANLLGELILGRLCEVRHQ